MTPEEFIDTAEKLLVERAKEADKRSAISRAYYGAFHACMECMPKEYAPTREQLNSAESHKSVIDALASWGSRNVSGRTDAAQAARTLASLKRARRRADYDIELALNEGDVDSCVKRSRKVVELIRYAKRRHDVGCSNT
jgi:uncharacterized protein (UPF0332 family)